MLHHDLLTRLEDWLRQEKLLLDINLLDSNTLDYSDESLRKLVTGASFITAEGWAEFQAYDRFAKIAANFNALSEFFEQSSKEALTKSPEWQAIQDQISSMRQLVNAERDPSRKGQIKQKLKELESSIQERLKAQRNVLPEWQVKGIDLFIQTFMPNRLDLRIYPFEKNPRFNIVSNLKRDCFVDADIENVLFAYGSRPNVLLTVFGLITSAPSIGNGTFDATRALATGADQKARAFEVGIRSITQAFEPFENATRLSYYPNITVYPVAVYQRIVPLSPSEE